MDLRTYWVNYPKSLLKTNNSIYPGSISHLFLVFCFGILALSAGAQGGCYGYGSNKNDIGHDLVQLPDGDIVLAGEINKNSGDAFLMRFEPESRNIVWEKIYSTNGPDAAKGVVVQNGFIYMAGYAQSSNRAREMFVLKVDISDGSIVGGTSTNAAYGSSNQENDQANDIITTKDGNIAIAGYGKSNSSGSKQSCILKLSTSNSSTGADLSIANKFVHGTSNGTEGYALEQDSEDDFWLVGQDQNNSGNGHFYQLEQDFSNDSTSILFRGEVSDDNQQTLNTIEEQGDYMIIAGQGNFENANESPNVGTQSAFALKFDHRVDSSYSASKSVTKMKQFYNSSNTKKSEVYDLNTSTSAYTFTGQYKTSSNSELLYFQLQPDFTFDWDQAIGGNGAKNLGNSTIQLQSGSLSIGQTKSGDYKSSNDNGGNHFLVSVEQSGESDCGNSSPNTQSLGLSKSNLVDSNLVNGEPDLNNSQFSVYSSNFNKNSLNNLSVDTPSTTGFYSSSSSSSTLPVEFMNFGLTTTSSDDVKLTWQTASETRNQYFSILRSRYGESFQSIGRLEGQGTKTTSTSYQYTDQGLKKGNYYYKIRQTDFDGSQTSSSVKAIKVQQNHDLELNHLKTTPSASYLALNGSAKGVYTIRAYSAKGILLGEREVRLSESGSTFRFDNKVNSGNLMYLNVINQKTGKQVLGKKVVLPR